MCIPLNLSPLQGQEVHLSVESSLWLQVILLLGFNFSDPSYYPILMEFDLLDFFASKITDGIQGILFRVDGEMTQLPLEMQALTTC